MSHTPSLSYGFIGYSIYEIFTPIADFCSPLDLNECLLKDRGSDGYNFLNVLFDYGTIIVKESEKGFLDDGLHN